jgi:hypothetical protein
MVTFLLTRSKSDQESEKSFEELISTEQSSSSCEHSSPETIPHRKDYIRGSTSISQEECANSEITYVDSNKQDMGQMTNVMNINITTETYNKHYNTTFTPHIVCSST